MVLGPDLTTLTPTLPRSAQPNVRRMTGHTNPFSMFPAQAFYHLSSSGGPNRSLERRKRKHADHTHTRPPFLPTSDARRTTSGTFSSSSRAFRASTRHPLQAPTIPRSTSRGSSARSARATNSSARPSECVLPCAQRTARRKIMERALIARRGWGWGWGTTISEEGSIWMWT